MEHREHHHYAGHDIEISLLNFGPSRIRWIWRIDGLYVSKSRSTLESEELARSEALMYAQMMVAHLPKRAVEGAHS
jgi:hypothetical protein